jgi:hypothetical protein
MWMKGFSPKWISWVQAFILGGSMAVNIYDEVGPYFQMKKGLQRGDPLSPILFNIVADMLAILIKRAKADNQISGIVPHLIDEGLSTHSLLTIRYSLWIMTSKRLAT